MPPSRAPLAAHLLQAASAPRGHAGERVRAEVLFMRSYEHMGSALLACEADCKCEAVQADAHEPRERTSVDASVVLIVSQVRMPLVASLLQAASWMSTLPQRPTR